jgi:hypothetical protein
VILWHWAYRAVFVCGAVFDRTKFRIGFLGLSMERRP